MKRQKHYTSEEEILKRIDELKAQANLLQDQSIELEMESNHLMQQVAELSKEKMTDGIQLKINKLVYDRKQLMAQCQKNNQLRNRITDATLPRMKSLLAAFRTEPFAFMEDRSVVA